jgi:hypothetical protein
LEKRAEPTDGKKDPNEKNSGAYLGEKKGKRSRVMLVVVHGVDKEKETHISENEDAQTEVEVTSRGAVITYKYSGSQQSWREVKPKFIDST